MPSIGQNYFQTLINNIIDLIQVVDAEGRVLYSSNQLLELTGYTPEEAEQLEPFVWIHPDDLPFIRETFEQWKQSGFERFLLEYRLKTKDGVIKHVQTRVTNAINDPLVRGYIAVVRDVTERVLAEERIRRQRSLYQLMTDISTRFLNDDMQPALEAMLEKVGLFAGVDRAYVYLFDRKRNYWDCLHEWRSAGSEPFDSLYYQTGVSNKEMEWMTEQFEQGKIIMFADIESMPPEAWRVKALFKADCTISILLIPMLVNQQLMGFIGFDSVLSSKDWQSDDVTTLQICTEILTSALLRADAQKAMQEQSMALAQFETLKTQVNPHFLFNSLNVLSSLVHINADLAEKFIDQLARSYRYLLEQKDKELVPIETEVDFIHAFTFLLNIRFEEKLSVRIKIDPKVMQHLIAPLTLQLLIENAVKHNVISMDMPLEIEVYNDADTWLVVRNNLQLREDNAHSTGVGIKNIVGRYKLFTPVQAEFYAKDGYYYAKIPVIKPLELP